MSTVKDYVINCVTITKFTNSAWRSAVGVIRDFITNVISPTSCEHCFKCRAVEIKGVNCCSVLLFNYFAYLTFIKPHLQSEIKPLLCMYKSLSS